MYALIWWFGSVAKPLNSFSMLFFSVKKVIYYSERRRHEFNCFSLTLRRFSPVARVMPVEKVVLQMNGYVVWECDAPVSRLVRSDATLPVSAPPTSETDQTLAPSWHRFPFDYWLICINTASAGRVREREKRRRRIFNFTLSSQNAITMSHYHPSLSWQCCPNWIATVLVLKQLIRHWPLHCLWLGDYRARAQQ